MALHTIEPDSRTLHGHFSRDLSPVLTIDPGDTVRFRTLDAGWGLGTPALPSGDRQKAERDDGSTLRGHALCGPVAINGAEPGMTLEVRIDAIQPGSYGYTYSGGFSHLVHDGVGTTEGDEELLVWSLDSETMTATDQHGFSVKMRPFMGVLGMPPPEPGQHITAPPRIWGGNLDCKELIPGTTLYLPIPVKGGLFSAGDGHAAQGDGEVSVTAIECPMDWVDLTFQLHDDMPINTPHARLHNAWMTLGFDEDLGQASLKALNAILDVMMARYDISRKRALALASAVVDLRVTQLANGVVGVHAILEDDAIQR